VRQLTSGLVLFHYYYSNDTSGTDMPRRFGTVGVMTDLRRTDATDCLEE